MDNYSGNKEYNIYRDIRNRTNGEIYLGIVGPVRTGKSTFIKRFMELMVLPFMEGEAEKERAMDELPQAAAGKTIMTTEPKFIPQQAAEIRLSDFKTEEEPLKLRVRLIDCVGFLADGAVGHMEGNGSRMVKTPWSDQEIPFAEAASIGTEKVIRDHATIGIVVTTDGTIGELARENYINAEERTVQELKNIGKPFVILLNSAKPYAQETIKLASEMEENYQTTVVPVNCEQLRREDVLKILESVLYEFPIERVEFFIPKWTEMLSADHPLVTPVCEGKPGHPILLRSSLIDSILKDDGSSGLEGAVEHCGTPMYFLNVEDPGIIHDADTPEDYAELLHAHNQSLIRSEIHIQLAREKVFFDEQLYSLLTLIHETGSVRDACEHMHISYSTSWNLIRTLESQLHEPLISRSQGGVNGSHSELTPYGEEFLKRYARFSEETRNCSEKIFENCFRGFFNA